MLNLNSTIDLNFKQFFRWWRRELSFLVPEKIRLWIVEERGFIIVRPQGQQLLLSYAYEDHEDPLATVDRGSKDPGLAGLYEADARLPKARVILRLTAQDAIQKELSLPAAAKENLQQVVAYELDRLTPFKAEQVYFTVQVLPGSNEPGQLRVMLILTSKALLDGLYEDLKTQGLTPVFVDFDGSPNDLERIDDGYNLLPEYRRQKTPKLPQIINAALITLCVLLFAVVIALPVWFEYQTVNALEIKAATLEKEAKKVKALQADIDAVIDETRQLIAEKSATPEVLVMLNTLSELINNDTWLAYLQYQEGHLQIQGESPAASGLIAVLEAADLFTNARFASPVTQDSQSKLERFQITVDVGQSKAADADADENAETDTASE